MAKRKTPKVKDLRPETITQEELQKLQGIVKAMNQGQQQLGIIETQKHNILHDIVEIQNLLQTMQKEFVEVYGTYDVSIADGTIKYNDDNKADKKDNDR